MELGSRQYQCLHLSDGNTKVRKCFFYFYKQENKKKKEKNNIFLSWGKTTKFTKIASSKLGKKEKNLIVSLSQEHGKIFCVCVCVWMCRRRRQTECYLLRCMYLPVGQWSVIVPGKEPGFAKKKKKTRKCIESTTERKKFYSTSKPFRLSGAAGPLQTRQQKMFTLKERKKKKPQRLWDMEETKCRRRRRRIWNNNGHASYRIPRYSSPGDGTNIEKEFVFTYEKVPPSKCVDTCPQVHPSPHTGRNVFSFYYQPGCEGSSKRGSLTVSVQTGQILSA